MQMPEKTVGLARQVMENEIKRQNMSIKVRREKAAFLVRSGWKRHDTLHDGKAWEDPKTSRLHALNIGYELEITRIRELQ